MSNYYTVRNEFFNYKLRKCVTNSELGGYRMGCHCIEASSKCRKVLHFLALDGRFSIMANIQLLHQDAMTEHYSKYTVTFDNLIDEVVYPIFVKRFLRKSNKILEDASKWNRRILEIKTEQECKNNGPDCIVAQDRLDATLNNFFRKFGILNLEYGSSIAPAPLDWERYYGTMVASMNFHLDMDYELFWHSLGASDWNPAMLKSPMTKANVASTQLQSDLVGLLNLVIPSQNTSFTDVLGLLGYSSIFGELNGNSSNLGSLANLLPLYGFDHPHSKKTGCDLGQHLRRWNQYIQILGNIVNNGIEINMRLI